MSEAEAAARPDIVKRLRKTHAEIVESDGGECQLMAMVREAADEIERLRGLTPASGEAASAALRLVDYLGSPRRPLTFAHDAKIVAEYVLSLRPAKKGGMSGNR